MVSSTATAGNLLKGGVPFMHDFGFYNTFVGANAGNFVMTTGLNTATGTGTLQAQTSGGGSTAYGAFALGKNTTAFYNAAVGADSLYFNTTGDRNTATGTFALYSNTVGCCNTASGFSALNSNTEGIWGTATGIYALYNNTTGSSNTATGPYALFANLTGGSNTAIGQNALGSNTTGGDNTALGLGAGVTATSANANTTGSKNTFIGSRAGPGTTAQLSNATAIGANALVSASDALVLGDYSVKVGLGTQTPLFKLDVVSGTNAGLRVQTALSGGTVASFGGNGDFRIYSSNVIGGRLFLGQDGSLFVPGIRNTPIAGAQVFVDPSGRLGVQLSSARFKEDVRDMGHATDGLRRLRPVTFYYKQAQQSGPRALQYGLIAEEVANVYPELVEYSETGEPFTVRYQLLGAMLLNEVQKQDRQIQEQQRLIQAQAEHVGELQAQLAAIADRLKRAGSVNRRHREPDQRRGAGRRVQ
jgi:hypothetical protein